MPRAKKGEGPSASDLQTRRLVGLMVSFSNARHPLSSEEIRRAHYPDLSSDTFLRQFSRDRARLANAGLVIVRERSGKDEATWHAEPASFADTNALSAGTALMMGTLCSQLCHDPTFAQRNELRHALAKIEGAQERVVATSQTGRATSELPVLASLLECQSHQHVALVRYLNARGEESERPYAPFGSFGLRGHTYTVCALVDEAGGVQEGELRTLRDDRLLRVREQRQAYRIPADFSADDYRMLPFQIGPAVGTARLCAGPGASTSARSELARRGTALGGDDVGALWEVPTSSIADTAAWAVAEGVTPLDPPELASAWRALLEAAATLGASPIAVDAMAPATGSKHPAPLGRPSIDSQVRELFALVGSLREQGSSISARQVSTALDVSLERARELLALVLSASTESSAQLPLGFGSDEDELVLCFSRGVRGRALRFTPQEESAMDAALDAMGLAADDPLRDEMHAAFGPLSPAQPAAAGAKPQAVPIPSEEVSERLEACTYALADGASLSFAYRGGSTGAPLRRRVEPLSVRPEDGRWYLDAYDLDRKARRTFRLDRMDDLRVSAQATTAPGEPDQTETSRSVTLLFTDPHLLELLDWPRLELVGSSEEGIVTRIPYYGGPWLPLHLAACGGRTLTDDAELAAATRAVAQELLG